MAKRDPAGRYQPVWLSEALLARLDRAAASSTAMLDLGLLAAETRSPDLAERLVTDMTRDLPAVLAGGGGRAAKYGSVWLSADRERRWKVLKKERGMTLAALIGLGLDADELRRGDVLAEFRLQVARDLRFRMAEYGLAPYPEPDAEHERELEYVKAPRPLRASAPPLRAGARPPGVRFRT